MFPSPGRAAMVQACTAGGAAAASSSSADSTQTLTFGFQPPPTAAAASDLSHHHGLLGCSSCLVLDHPTTNPSLHAPSSTTPAPMLYQLHPPRSSPPHPWSCDEDGQGMAALVGVNNNNGAAGGSSGGGGGRRSQGSSAAAAAAGLGVGAVRMKKAAGGAVGAAKARRKLREPRFCFKTMSDVDVLDDGYKWRKYGQKVVKNTQHPRSYYRCTQDKCRVKKRVERLAEDPRMVITTYEGRHVHSPSRDVDGAAGSGAGHDRAGAEMTFIW